MSIKEVKSTLVEEHWCNSVMKVEFQNWHFFVCVDTYCNITNVLHHLYRFSKYYIIINVAIQNFSVQNSAYKIN